MIYLALMNSPIRRFGKIKTTAIAVLIFLFFFIAGSLFPSHAQEDYQQDPPKKETLEATVVGIIEEKIIMPKFGEKEQLYQKLELVVTKGSLKDKKIVVQSGNLPIANLQKYKVGDKLVINVSENIEGNAVFYISDYVRRTSLLWLFLIFVVLAITVGKWWGLSSIMGMGFSFLIIFKYILPKLLAGADPIVTAVIGSLFIIPVTFYLSHGLNKKTSIAIVGTVISLIITGVLAGVFVEKAQLTGFASEEAGFLQIARQGEINIRGLLLAGIIIGTLGVLDDVTVSQSSIVNQLKETDKSLSFKKLYQRAMKVGQDHISSMVNTLVLVYTGAALPLLLLFVDNPHPFSEIINYEIIADEIVRTLVGSIGLILAVPITTLLAALSFEKKKQ